MGISHITAAKTVKGQLNLERFKTTGLITTHAANSFVTDSAAAATALATGYKVNKGAISCRPDGMSLKTLLEYAHENGKSTGIVVTSSVTEATPASFVVHVRHWNHYNHIAEAIAQSGINVLFGGGFAYFLPQSSPNSMRNDEKNLIAQLSRTHRIVTSTSEFSDLTSSENVIGLFAPKHLPKASSRDISLTEMTKSALTILSKNTRGFVLIVEGSQIDWAGHKNDSDWLIQETLDFDEAVKVGFDFAEQNQSTLLVVTSDHSTGGYALEAGSVEEKTITGTDFTTDYHTAEMVPLFAFGPGSRYLGGIQDNTDIGRIMIDFVRLANEQPAIGSSQD